MGIESLTTSGDFVTDSYDSQSGFYDPATAGDRGSICSDGPVKVSGSPIVNGDAMAGPGDAVNVSGSAQVTGYIGNRTKPLTMPAVDASAAKASNDNDTAPLVWQGQSWRKAIAPNGDLRLNAGAVYWMPPGTYYLRKVTLVGGSTLNFTGPTTIYVTGTFRREGGCFVNNFTRLPRNLRILSTGGTIDITSDNPFHGVIYAPQSTVTVNGDSGFFGAIVGNTLKMNGSGQAHYDESLDLEDLGVAPRTMLVD